jgi:RHS repeat-associated protein
LFSFGLAIFISVSGLTVVPRDETDTAAAAISAPPLAMTAFAGDGVRATRNGTGTSASFNAPSAVDLSGGSAYVATTGSIRHVDLATRHVSLLAGHETTQACTDSPNWQDVRFKTISDIVISNGFAYTAGYCTSTSYRIRETSLATGATRTVASIRPVKYLAVGPDGMLYAVANPYLYRVSPVTGSFEIVTSFPGSVWAVAADDSFIWVAWMLSATGSKPTIEQFTTDGAHTSFLSSGLVGLGGLESAGPYLYSSTSSRITRIVKSDGSADRVLGSGGNGFAEGTGTDAWLYSVEGVAYDGASLWLADNGNNRLLKAIPVSPLPSAQPPAFTQDLGITTAAVVTTAGNGANATVDETGTSASFRTMGGVAIVGGFAYVGTHGAIRKVDLETKEVTTFVGHPTEMDCRDSLLRADVRFSQITDVTTDGYYLYTTSTCSISSYWVRRTSLQTGATSLVASVKYAKHITFGPDGFLYTTGGQGLNRVDPSNGTVQLFHWFNSDAGAIASDDQYLYVARDKSNDRMIERIALDGTVTKIADNDDITVSALASAGNFLYVGYRYGIRVYFKGLGGWINILGVPEVSGFQDGTGPNARMGVATGIASDGKHLWIADGYRFRKAAQGYLWEETLGACGVDDISNNPCRLESDPVNTATGNFYSTATDARLPGIGVPFEFTRTYNSLDTTAGPLGTGWTHTYNTSLALGGSGEVTLRTADGGQVKFFPAGGGAYWSGSSVRATLTKQTDHTFVLVDHARKTYRFDSQGRLTSLKDRNGQGLTFSHASGQLDAITDSGGRSIALSYSGGLLSSVSLPGPRSVHYGYTNGRLTSVIDLRGGTTAYTYGAAGRLATIVDQNGRTVVENTYGADGRITQQLDAEGNLGTFAWDAATETSTFTDARGNAWVDDYQEGQLVRQTDPLGNSVRFAYTDGYVTSVTDPRGNATHMTYDARGNLTSLEAPTPLAYRQSFTYDSSSNLLSATDGRGNVTSYQYDGAGNLINTTQPGSVVTSLGRDPVTGLVTSLTDPRSEVTTFEYDAAGNLVRVTAPGGGITARAHDASGRITSVVEARGNVDGANPADYRWTFDYDDADNLRTVSDPLGNTAAWTYDPLGRLASRTDAKNRTTSFGYNNAGDLISVTAPDATVTAYEYDKRGNLTRLTDARGHVTSYGLDPANRLTEVTDPLGNRWTYSYDAAGNLLSETTARGNATPETGDGTINRTFDVLNRVTGIDYSDATPDVTFGYDANGNRTQMTDGSGTETYSFDALNRLTGATRGADSFSYQYDPAGNVTKRIYPDGTVVDFTYDEDGRMATVASEDASTSYAYDPAGHLLTTTFPAGNGHVETRVYDRASRLTEVENAKGGTVLSRFSQTLDAVGNPTQVVTPTSTTNYSYDSLDRLTDVCFQTSCLGASDPYIRWAYDDVGNRTSETRPTGTEAYTYNAADQLVSTTGSDGMTYSYDADGNQTAAGSRTSAYDLANRMTETTSGSTTVNYSYDGDGKRLLASSGNQAAEKTKYLWDSNHPFHQLALERDGSNDLRRRYVHGRDLVSMFTGGAEYFFHHDSLGSVANVTSATGASQWTYGYEPFGTLSTETEHNTEAPTNVMRFTGEMFDTDTALYHLRARQYDSSTGRFTSIDPLPWPRTVPYVSNYAYVASRPTALIDPSGMRGIPPWYVDVFTNFGEVYTTGCEELQDPSNHLGTVMRILSVLPGDEHGETGARRIISAGVWGIRGLGAWAGKHGATKTPAIAKAVGRAWLSASVVGTTLDGACRLAT